MNIKKLNYEGKELSYYSNKEMREMYPDGVYLVYGEISKKVGPYRDMPLYDEDGSVIYVQPFKTYNGLYKTDGYLWNEEAEGFVLVKKSNIIKIINMCLLTLLIIGGLIYGGYYFLNKSNVDPNAVPFESTAVKRSENMDDSRILVPGYNDWNMLAGTNELYVALYNPDKNPCYFQFSVILDETEEVLFKTELVPPGQAVTKVKLPRVFTEGVYPITVMIHSFSLSDNSQKLNGGEVKTNIVALSE